MCVGEVGGPSGDCDVYCKSEDHLGAGISKWRVLRLPGCCVDHMPIHRTNSFVVSISVVG